MDPEKKNELYFPTKHVIPESLKFSHWLSETSWGYQNLDLYTPNPGCWLVANKLPGIPTAIICSVLNAKTIVLLGIFNQQI